jgi:hypothetical protein
MIISMKMKAEAVASVCQRWGFFCARSVFGGHAGQHCKLTLKV